MHKVRIYNLFPLLAGTLTQWEEWVEHAADLGFSWIYINSPFAAGASGNLFALADPFALDPRFDDGGDGESGICRLQRFLCRHRERGLRFMTDFNPLHAASDAPVVQRHPGWFVRDASGSLCHPLGADPLDPDTMRVWEDLAEADFTHSAEVVQLRGYWESVLAFWVSLGFTGFRCLHATALSPDFWRGCIRRALCTAREPVLFVADALGEPVERVAALHDAGFHLIYNSSCWWQFDSPWAVEQHAFLQRFAPTLSFPENHDTPRLFARTQSLINVQKQRYLFAAFFSSALQMTMGYEFCWKKPMSAAHTSVADQEDRRVDIGGFIRACNRLADAWPLLQAEGSIRASNPYWEAVLALEKTAGNDSALLVLNKDWNREQTFFLDADGWVCRPFSQDSPWNWEPHPAGEWRLEPAECLLVRQKAPLQEWRVLQS